MKRSKLFQKMTALFLALGFVLLLMVAVVGNPTTAKPVSAETTETQAETAIKDNEDTDEYFDFADGAKINILPTRLRFILQQPSAYFDNSFDAVGEESALKLTLYKYGGTETANSAKCEILIYSKRELRNWKVRSHVYVCAREIEHDSEIDVSSVEITRQLVDEDITYSSDFLNAKEFKEESGYKNFKVLYEGFRLTPSEGMEEPHTHPFEFDRSENIPVLNITFPVSGLLSSYFVRAEYEIENNIIASEKTGSLTSPRRSVFDVLSAIEEAGKMETTFATAERLAEAQSLLAACKEPKKITVNYLEDIDGTYFSEKKTAEISVAVKDGTIFVDDVKDALGKQTLKVQNTYVKGFTANDEKTEFTAQYLSSVWLRTRTVDGGGHYVDMFLDLNKSYGDYFATLANTIANGKGLYEWMWAGFIDLCPVLEGKDPNNVHGFFGMVWLPKRSALSSFDAAMASLFSVKNEEFGFIKHFKGELEITNDEHTALMKTYKYNWMSKAWDGVLNFVGGKPATAEFYFFAAKPMTYTGISQTGNTDPDDDDGAGKEVIDDAVDDIGDWFDDLLSGGNSLKRLSSVVVVAACAVGVIWAIGKLKGNGKGKK